MEIEFKLDSFTGPLDLLLSLIEKNKVSIYDIPIVSITDQYLSYVAEMEKEDLNVVSEFLVMAAMLLNIKSKMLLPREETENEEESEDPRDELVEKLLEYKMYKYASEELRDMQTDADRNMYKIPTLPEDVKDYIPPVDMEKLMGDLTLTKLKAIFDEVLKRQEDKIDPIRSKFGKIEKEEIDMEERARYVSDFIHEYRNCSFRALLTKSSSKMEVVVTFLVILEMIKAGKVQVIQEKRQDDILIKSLEE